MSIEYKYTGDNKVPAIIMVGNCSTPVWIQQELQKYTDVLTAAILKKRRNR